MKQYLDLLLRCALFETIKETDLAAMLSCLSGRMEIYKKSSVILLAGSAVSAVGIVLSGSVQIIKEDYLGNKNILAELSPSEIFAETFACAGTKQSPVTVVSATGCEVLWLETRKMITACPSACSFHTALISNMLRLIANKNLMLSQKIEFISMRTIREKLLAYFTMQVQKADSRSFAIPFSRQELADFLCADRSALSRELCKMRDDGLLQFHGNKFEMMEYTLFMR